MNTQTTLPYFKRSQSAHFLNNDMSLSGLLKVIPEPTTLLFWAMEPYDKCEGQPNVSAKLTVNYDGNLTEVCELEFYVDKTIQPNIDLAIFSIDILSDNYHKKTNRKTIDPQKGLADIQLTLELYDLG